MGLGILGVMLAHFLVWIEAKGLVVFAFKPFIGLVFTEGFLLLSGLGLYYSFRKNSELIVYYKKRVDRLLLPFMIISFPFYIARCIEYHLSFEDFLLYISSLHFWVKGNDGMWYISVALMLYLIFPLFYKFIFGKPDSIIKRGAFVIILYYAIAYAIYALFPNYYELVGEGVSQIPMFFVGIMVGYLAFNKLHLKRDVFFISVLAVFAIVFNMLGGYTGDIGNGFLRFLCIIILCPLLLWTERHSIISEKIIPLIEWFGKYTLELYMLHMFIYLAVYKTLGNIWGGYLLSPYQYV